MKPMTSQKQETSQANKRWRGQEGFSLIEILVALVIMFSLTAVGTVAFVSFIPKIRLSSVTNELSFSLQRSRLLAIRKNRPVKVEFGVATGGMGYFESCYINDTGDCVDDDGNILGNQAGISLVVLPIEAGIVLLDNTFDSDEIVFNGDGTVDSTGHIRMGIWEDTTKTRLRYSSQVEIAKLDGSRVEVTPPEKNPLNPNTF